MTVGVIYYFRVPKTKSKQVESVEVNTFIGRMVQHIMPRFFQRVRYYGLEATKTYKKWAKVIQAGIKKIGRLVKGVYQIVRSKGYRERYKISGIDPLSCRYCGKEMGVWKIWHPQYGIIYDDEEEKIRSGEYESGGDRRLGHSVRSPSGPIQLPLFSVSI